MHNEAQIILQQVFNKRSLNDVSISELKTLTEQYPYFNAAQFLLAKKIRQEKSEVNSAKHPALFFHNPLWFNFLMKQEFKSNDQVVEDELVLDSKNLAAETEAAEEFEQINGNEIPEESTELKSGDNHQPEIQEIQTSFVQDGQDEVEVNEQNDYRDDDQIQNQKIAESLKQTSLEQKKPTDESLEFEPFHTIDYFASQGIRLQQADLSKDKFGQQLRSFTEWLKSMKKIPAPSPEDTGDPVVQEQVIQFAQVSNETKEIITETMAEVWSLQGNRQKAIEIYKKLSLLNPAKSAYFASKIDKLNS